ncbi:hypothetical protein EDD11_001215 [Mortierella claussenii]|nr:hypothetical protein EDD11_001215 [Mortierella claussenii]
MSTTFPSIVSVPVHEHFCFKDHSCHHENNTSNYNAYWDSRIQVVTEWPKDKDSTPLGTLPVLIETDLATGQTMEIPESSATECYLARKSGLLGDTPREQILKRALEQFLGTTLSDWVKCCERHLKENGNKGHFVDNKVEHSF